MFTRVNNEWRLQTQSGSWSLGEFTNGRTRPFYLYDVEDALLRADRFLASQAQIHYAMKANALPRLLKALAQRGMGVDVVSLGEMQLALNSGFSPEKIIFSGVAKKREDLEAALGHGIYQINVESFEELQCLAHICSNNHQSADVALRLNIHLDAPTHKNIQTSTSASKFGLDLRQMSEVLDWLRNHSQIRLKGLAVHIGSQITDLSVFERMSQAMGDLYRDVGQRGFALERLDLGGGLGLDYGAGPGDDFEALDHYLRKIMLAHKTPARILLEPGRFLVARMGVLLTQAVYIKRSIERNFLILDAGMNCLMRPALYQAYHHIEPIRTRDSLDQETYTIVGPICESTDTFAEARTLPRVQPGDWLAIFDVGAYGAVMANTYNQTGLPEQWSVWEGRTEVF